MEITVDTKEYKALKDRFERMHKSVFPRIVRNTLNDLAFDMKGGKGRRGTIEARSRTEFEHVRSKTFIKSITGVNKATGYDINKMQSTAGVEAGIQNKTRAADGLAKQEDGTSIKHEWVPLNSARVGKNEKKGVKSRARHKNMPDYIDVTDLDPRIRIKVMLSAAKKKLPVLVKGRKNGKEYIARPTGILNVFRPKGKKALNKRAKTFNRRKEKRNYRAELEFLYVRNKGGVANLKKRRKFVTKAGQDSIKKLDKFFTKHAKNELDRQSKRR